MFVDALIRLLRVCLDYLTLFRGYLCCSTYHYVLFPALFLSVLMSDDAFVLILCNCLDYAKHLRHYSCLQAYQDASRQAHSSEFLACDDTTLLKYDIDPSLYRPLQTILSLRSLQFGIRAYLVASKTFHRSIRTHPCALPALSSLLNSSNGLYLLSHSILGLRWLRGYTLHVPLNSIGVAASPG